jgi:hypothetical protein
MVTAMRTAMMRRSGSSDFMGKGERGKEVGAVPIAA